MRAAMHANKSFAVLTQDASTRSMYVFQLINQGQETNESLSSLSPLKRSLTHFCDTNQIPSPPYSHPQLASLTQQPATNLHSLKPLSQLSMPCLYPRMKIKSVPMLFAQHPACARANQPSSRRPPPNQGLKTRDPLNDL
jgi:hypothetical protein